MVSIPMHIWEVIRTPISPDLSLAEITEDEIRDIAEQQVYMRSSDFADHKHKEIICGLYYGASRPRDAQVSEALQHLGEQRNEQRKICAAAEAIRNKNRPTIRLMDEGFLPTLGLFGYTENITGNR